MASAFANLGVCREVLDIIEKLSWKHPSEIQVKALPHAFRGKDIIGLAETGSGKTAAFAIPILQSLIMKPRHNFALILTPTRELAMQSKAQFLQLGEAYGLKVICLVGGQHSEDQAHELKTSKFHVIIGTPGRLVYHLENSKELRLDKIRYFVLDEADQLVEESFESQLKLILSKLPASHITYLYSATLGEQTKDIQALCLRNPVTIEVSSTYSKVDKLDHAFVFLPERERNYFLVYLLMNSVTQMTGLFIIDGALSFRAFYHFVTNFQSASKNQTIVFTTTWRESFRIAGLLKALTPVLGTTAVPLNGVMQQDKRQEALFKFRSGAASILVATDLAARGLDIPGVDLVVNYDVPRRPSWSDSAKAYIHRVGRTARAGRCGRAVTLVTPYSAGRLKAIEASLGEHVPQLPWPGSTSMPASQRELVAQADNLARANLRKRDKQKRLVQKKRQVQKVRRLHSFADPVHAASSTESDSS